MSTVSPASRPRIAAKARLKWDRHAQKHMLLYPERGLVLNDSAAAIVELCDGASTIGEIARALAARAGRSAETIEADVIAFVEAMHRRGLLVVDDA
jgi:pyrroloquinoline quinone biosynthesis protein D